VQAGRRERLAQVLDEAHAADIAAAMRDLSIDDQVTVFRLLGREQAGPVLAELDDQTLLELVRALDEAEISTVLDRMQRLSLEGAAPPGRDHRGRHGHQHAGRCDRGRCDPAAPLKSFRIDPAIASSVIITTFTDVCGFFSFLGLATLLIKFLL